MQLRKDREQCPPRLTAHATHGCKIKVVRQTVPPVVLQGQVAAAEVSRAKAQAAGERAELGRRAAAASAAARNVVKVCAWSLTCGGSAQSYSKVCPIPSELTAARGPCMTCVDFGAQARAEGWAKTGIVSLLNEGLATVPEAAWQVGAAMRALELSGNRLTALPGAAVVELHGLRVLRLAGNHLTAAGVPWPELAGCPSLLTLVLDGNPCAACLLTDLASTTTALHTPCSDSHVQWALSMTMPQHPCNDWQRLTCIVR